MLRAFTAAQLCVLLLISACTQPSATEREVVGAWSWSYIEGVGRMIFSADHTVKMGVPPDDKDGRVITDSEFEILGTGTWRLEGDVLITEIDNERARETIRRLAPSEVPPFEKKTERKKIVSIDDM